MGTDNGIVRITTKGMVRITGKCTSRCMMRITLREQ